MLMFSLAVEISRRQQAQPTSTEPGRSVECGWQRHSGKWAIR